MKAQDYKISSEKFVFRSENANLHDKKLETKPVTYFRAVMIHSAIDAAS